VKSGIARLYYFNLSRNKIYYRQLQPLLGYCPINIKLYKLAFVHNSNSESVRGLKTKTNNERLEFLGDAVLDVIIAELLFKKFPFQGEGFLTEMRSKCVSRKKLAEIAQKMGLNQFLQLDQAILRNSSAVRGISGNALEALVGAVYLDKGYKYTKEFVRNKIVTPYLDFDIIKEKVENYKSVLNQWSQKERKTLAFKVIEEKGENHQKLYTIGVFVDDSEISRAKGKSKKIAEQLASEIACNSLKLFESA
jgi:ribonuclease-3